MPIYMNYFQSKVTNTTHNAREHKTENIQTYLIVLMISISMK